MAELVGGECFFCFVFSTRPPILGDIRWSKKLGKNNWLKQDEGDEGGKNLFPLLAQAVDWLTPPSSPPGFLLTLALVPRNCHHYWSELGIRQLAGPGESEVIIEDQTLLCLTSVLTWQHNSLSLSPHFPSESHVILSPISLSAMSFHSDDQFINLSRRKKNVINIIYHCQ